jgi:hypothetical protein
MAGKAVPFVQWAVWRAGAFVGVGVGRGLRWLVLWQAWRRMAKESGGMTDDSELLYL